MWCGDVVVEVASLGCVVEVAWCGDAVLEVASCGVVWCGDVVVDVAMQS